MEERELGRGYAEIGEPVIRGRSNERNGVLPSSSWEDT